MQNKNIITYASLLFCDYSHSNLIFLKSAQNRLLTSWDVYFSRKKFTKQ